MVLKYIEADNLLIEQLILRISYCICAWNSELFKNIDKILINGEPMEGLAVDSNAVLLTALLAKTVRHSCMLERNYEP